jgi:hypothetical protein
MYPTQASNPAPVKTAVYAPAVRVIPAPVCPPAVRVVSAPVYCPPVAVPQVYCPPVVAAPQVYCPPVVAAPQIYCPPATAQAYCPPGAPLIGAPQTAYSGSQSHCDPGVTQYQQQYPQAQYQTQQYPQQQYQTQQYPQYQAQQQPQYQTQQYPQYQTQQQPQYQTQQQPQYQVQQQQQYQTQQPQYQTQQQPQQYGSVVITQTPQASAYAQPSAGYAAPTASYAAPASAYGNSGYAAAVIKPQMPNPNGYGVYRVQIGSYADPQNAQAVAESLLRLGLSPAYEQFGQFWRVVLPGIQCADLPSVAQRLGSCGIKEAWIRLEG